MSAIQHTIPPERARKLWDRVESLPLLTKAQLEKLDKHVRRAKKGISKLEQSAPGSEGFAYLASRKGELNQVSCAKVEVYVGASREDQTKTVGMSRFKLENILPGVLSHHFSKNGEYREIHCQIPFGAWIELDFWGVRGGRREASLGFSSVTPHVTLYKDMANHYNQAVKLLRPRESSYSPKEVGALNRAWRAALVSGLQCIEAYMNSIAFDHIVLVDRSGDELSPDDKRALYEEKNRRGGHLTFRKKLHEYPKIISGADSPPLQESNCPAMKHVLKVEKTIRHAIIHPKNKVEGFESDFWSYSQDRMLYFYGTGHKDVTKTVDAVGGLIGEIETLIIKRWGVIAPTFTAVPRNKEGLFPPEALI